ncbi:MAG: LamG-like jellyroll fold domain-containing protein, partial [Bacteroidota bacterium]
MGKVWQLIVIVIILGITAVSSVKSNSNPSVPDTLLFQAVATNSKIIPTQQATTIHPWIEKKVAKLTACQPFNIQAMEVKPNIKCDGGADNGIAEAELASASPLPSGNQIGNWKLDGDYQDDEPNGGNSILRPNPVINGPTFISTELGGGINLNGSDSYLAMTGPRYDANNYEQVTVAAWIQTAAANAMTIISFDDNEYWELRKNTVGQLVWVVNTNAGQAILTSNTVVDDGVWHHIVASYDQGVLSIYVDGELDAQMTQGTEYGSGNTRYGMIGVASEADQVEGAVDASGGFFNGNLDEIKLYDDAFSPSEILDIYQSGTPYDPPLVSDLTFYWFRGTQASGSPVAATQRVYNLADDLYTVVAQDNISGCFSNPTQVTISRGYLTLQPVIWETSPYTSCSAPNGQLQAGVVVGSDTITSGYNFTWYETASGSSSTVSLQSSASNLSATSYTVYIQDPSTNCDTVVSLSVSSNVVTPTVMAQIDQHVTSCNSPTSGSISATSGGTTVGYDFRWFAEGSNIPFANSASVNGLAPGRYTVVATNSTTGCSSDPDTVEVLNQTTDPVIVTSVTDQSNCDPNNPNGVLEAAVDTGSGTTTVGYTFVWYEGYSNSPPTARSGYSSGATVDQIIAGNYRVVVTENSSGCSSFVDVIVSDITTSPVLSLQSQTNVRSCGGTGDASVTVGGGSLSDYDFYWYAGNLSAPDTTNTSAMFGTGNSIGGLSIGTYTAFAANKTSRCLSNAVTVTIVDSTEIPAINTTVLANQTSCNTTTPNGIIRATVGASADTIGYLFEWYDGTFSSATLPTLPDKTGATQTEVAAGDYTVRVTNQTTNCSNISYLIISDAITYPLLDNSPTVVQPTACTSPWGSSISVTADGGSTEADGYSFTWTNVTSNTTLPDVTATVTDLAPGTYRVTTTSPTGCVSSALTFQLDTPTNPFTITISEIQPNTSCNPALPSGQLEALVGGTATGYSFAWFSGTLSESATTTASAIDTASLADSLAAGSYTVRVTDNTTDCVQIGYTTLTASPEYPTIDISPTVVQPGCANPADEHVIGFDDDLGQSNPYKFRLYGIEGDAGAINDFKNYDGSGRYQHYSIPVGTYYTGAMQYLFFNTDDDAKAGGQSYFSNVQVYEDTNGNGINDECPSGCEVLFNQPLVSYAGALQDKGTYTILDGGQTVLIDSDAWKAFPFNYTVTANTWLEFDFKTGEEASRGNISVTADGGNTETDGYQFTWINVTTGTTLPDTTATINALLPGTYEVTVTNPLGCTSQPTNVTLDAPTPSFTATATEVQPQSSCNPSTPNGILQASVGGVTSGYTFAWYQGTLSEAGINATKFFVRSSTVSGLAAGDYTVRVSDRTTGCIAIAYATVTENFNYPVLDNSATVVQPTACTAPWGSSISVNADGGLTEANGYSFTWTNVTTNTTLPNTTATVTNLAPGTYRVTATNPTGCISSALNFMLSDEGTPPSVTLTPYHNISCNPANSSGAVVASGFSGSASDYTFEWFETNTAGTPITTGITTDNTAITSLDAETYALRITNIATQCSSVEFATVYNSSEDKPVVDTVSTTDPTQCGSGSLTGANGSFYLTIDGGFKTVPGDPSTTRPYEFHVISDQGFNFTNTYTTDFGLLNQPAGIYKVAATDLLTGCISDTLTFTLEYEPVEVISLTYTRPTDCGGGVSSLGNATVKFATDANFPDINDIDTLWVSMLLRANTLTNGGVWFTPNSRGEIAFGKQFFNEFGIDNDVGTGLSLVAGQTYRLLARYVRTPSSTVASLWVDPVSATFDINMPLATKTTGNISSLDYFTLKLGEGSTGDYDLDEVSISCQLPEDISGTANSCTMALEGFDYSDGSPLIGESGGSGFSGSWADVSGGSQVGVSASSLSYPGISTSGNKLNLASATTAPGSRILVRRDFASGSGSGFTYSWVYEIDGTTVTSGTDTDFTTTRGLLEPGYYGITITDLETNCTHYERFLLEIDNPPNVMVDNVANVTSCTPLNGEVEFTLNPGVGTNPLTNYRVNLFGGDQVSATPLQTWLPTTAASGVSESHTFSDLDAGEYLIAVQINTSPFCYVAEGKFTVDENIPTPTITLSKQDDTTCDGSGNGSIVVSSVVGSDGSSDYVFNWYTSGGLLPFSTTSSINSQTAGTYRLEVIDNDGAGLGCGVDTTIIIEARPTEVVITTVDTDAESCDASALGSAYISSIAENGSPANFADYTLSLLDENAVPIVATGDGTAASPIINLTAGTYYLLAEHNTLGCESNLGRVTILNQAQDPSVTLSVARADFTCGTSGDGQLLASPRGIFDGDTDPTNFSFQ